MIRVSVLWMAREITLILEATDEALLQGRILWHTSIEREEKQRKKTMPK